MGYLSQVTLLCNFKMAEEVDRIIEVWAENHEWVRPTRSVDMLKQVYKYSWDWMKWYTGPHSEPFLPQDIEDLLEAVDSGEKPDYAYVYLRIGESDDDLEFRANAEGTPLEDVGIIRELDLSSLQFPR